MGRGSSRLDETGGDISKAISSTWTSSPFPPVTHIARERGRVMAPGHPE